MTPTTSTPPPRPSAISRYGPLSVVLVGILVAGILASTGRSEPDDTRPETVVGSTDDLIAMTWEEARQLGHLGRHDWGDRCDEATGRIMMPSVYAPPCVAVREGAERGATSLGVTDEAIKIVLYQSADDDLSASLQATQDPPEARVEAQRDILEMLSATMETWGREIETVVVKGTGSSETASRADAVKVATEIGAFASIGGPQQESAYAEELASRGVLCITCTLSAPNSFYLDHAPYVWGNLQTPEQYLPTLGEVTHGMLRDGKARFSSDPATREEDRVFGSVHFEQDPPVFSGVSEMVDEANEARDFEMAIRLTYQLVIPELGEKARQIIGQLKSAGVTTVVFLGDPIMPIYLTQEATNQNYFPEWVITGTVFTDTSTFGRMYDQRQWSAAFGVSQLPTTASAEQGEGYRLTRWYFDRDPVAPLTTNIAYDPLRLLMIGIHMAGPELTPETFRDGLFNYPPSGGTPVQPQLSWGDHGFFPGDDYTAFDDMQLIWYDPEAVGPDEQGKDPEGKGRMRYAFGGRRHLPGAMPQSDDWIHDVEGTVLDYSDGYPEDRTPEYPPPPRG